MKIQVKPDGGKDFSLRRFRAEDAIKVAALIADTLKESNAEDYPPEFIAANIASHSAKIITERANRAHMYVAVYRGEIVGCGAIDGFYGSLTESILLTVFVLPAMQRQGIGRAIVQALEADEFFLRAGRIEIPASLTAVEFYKKMGYGYKNGVTEPDGEGVVRLEKFR